jgi:sulfotransferase
MTSPVGSLFNAMLRETSQRSGVAVFIKDDTRARLLRGCFTAYYADIHQEKLVFDTNRLWTTKLPALAALFPEAKLICCVCNPACVPLLLAASGGRCRFGPPRRSWPGHRFSPG